MSNQFDDHLGHVSRLDELLAAQAIGDLSPEEFAELDALLAGMNGAGHAAAPNTQQAVGAVAAALHAPHAAPVAPELRAKLLAQGLAVTAAQAASEPGVAGRIAPAPLAPPSAASWMGWVAAAAAFMVAAVGWLRPVGLPPTPPSDPAWAQRQRLVAEHDDTIQITFANTADPASRELKGDVVWNQRLQRGYLRFRGLPKNDPATEQYQIWLVDKTRPADTPVSGGVFNTDPTYVQAETGDIVIPIDASLLVRDPVAFAVTLEKPGGVMVTGHERVVAVAKPGAPVPAPAPAPAPAPEPSGGQTPPK